MISVIIPLYNAVSFIEQAVISVVNQDGVIEVIIIDDGSTDGSFELVNKLSAMYSKIRVLTHENRKNKGAGLSRNLGIQESKGNWIAFLDADDVYLPDRFRNLLSNNQSIEEYDGIAESINTVFMDEKSKANYLLFKGTTLDSYKRSDLITGLKNDVKDNCLFNTLLNGEHGHVHLNALIVKSNVLKNNIYFNTWEIGEDTIFILKLAASYKIKVIPLSTVATRRVHSQNRWTQSYSKRMFYYHLYIHELFISFSLANVDKTTLKKLSILRIKLHDLSYIYCKNTISKSFVVFKNSLELIREDPRLFIFLIKNICFSRL